MYWEILPATSSWSGEERQTEEFSHGLQGNVFGRTSPWRPVVPVCGGSERLKHVSPRPVQEGRAVAVVEGAQVLSNRMGA